MSFRRPWFLQPASTVLVTHYANSPGAFPLEPYMDTYSVAQPPSWVVVHIIQCVDPLDSILPTPLISETPITFLIDTTDQMINMIYT